MKTAIILPLFDREGTGWKSLESALSQNIGRSDYAVVAVLGGRSKDEALVDPAAQALLSQCDAVVHYGEDLDGVENRMPIYRAGADAVSADVLFLVEGHTILKRDACAAIARHFDANPQSDILFAPRVNVSGTICSRIHEYMNACNQRGSPAAKVFSLGGESALRRDLFEAMAAVSENAGPFAETLVQHALRARAIPVATLDRPLCEHHNNWTAARTLKVAMMLGRAYCERFDDPSASILGITGRKRSAFALARHPGAARVLGPLALLTGTFCIGLGMPLFAVHKDLSHVVSAFGMKAATFAGFCRASAGRPRGTALSLAAQR